MIFRLRDDCRPFHPGERAELLSDDPAYNFGLKMVSRIAGSMEHVNLFKLNPLTIEM